MFVNVQLTPNFLEQGWLPPINFHVTPKFLECYPIHPYAGEASCPLNIQLTPKFLERYPNYHY